MFDIEESFEGDSFRYGSYRVVHTPDAIALCNLKHDVYYLFEGDSLRIVDKRTKELVAFCPDNEESASWNYGNSVRYFRTQYLRQATRPIYPLVCQDRLIQLYFTPLSFRSIKDSAIGGIVYKVLERDDTNGHIYNSVTQRFDIPEFYHLEYYYNVPDGALQAVIVRPMDYPNNWAFELGVKRLDIRTSYNPGDAAFLDSLFDFGSSEYNDYTRHDNIGNLPWSWRMRETTNARLDSNVLAYPIVSLDGDTTTMGAQPGWLLVDFWFPSCRPCIEQMRDIGAGTGCVDLRRLGELGVKFMMVNPLAASSSSLRPIGEKYGMTDYLYHARNFGQVFSVGAMPRMILISPDKSTYFEIDATEASHTIERIVGGR